MTETNNKMRGGKVKNETSTKFIYLVKKCNTRNSIIVHPDGTRIEINEEIPYYESNERLEINTKVAPEVTPTVSEIFETEKEIEIRNKETNRQNERSSYEFRKSTSSHTNVESAALAKLKRRMMKTKPYKEEKGLQIEDEDEIIEAVEEPHVECERFVEVAEDFVLGRRFANRWMKDESEDSLEVNTHPISIQAANPLAIK